MREPVFGPDADVLGAFDIALHAFARFPSASARIEALTRIARGVLPAGSRSVGNSDAGQGSPLSDPLQWAGRKSARILGVPQLARCFDFSFWLS